MKRSTILLLIAFSLIAVACPTVEPVNPEPEPEPKKDSSTVALSATRQFTVSDLIGKELAQQMNSASDGTYDVSFEGAPMDFSFEDLKDYDGSRLFKSYCKLPIGYDFKLGEKPSVPTGAGSSGEIDLSSILPATVNLGSRSKSMDIGVSGLPEQLSSLESITLTENSRVSVTLSLTNPFFTAGTVTPSFSVDLSKLFESSDAVDDILSFDAPLTKANGWSTTKYFRLSGVNFDPSNYDPEKHRLKLNLGVKLKGKVTYEGMKTTRSRLLSADPNIVLNVTVVLLDIACETITGSFNSKTLDQSATLEMKSLAAASAASIDASNAEVCLDLSGDLPVASKTTLKLTTKRGTRTIGQSGDIVIEMPAAEGGNVASVSKTLRASDEGMSAVLKDAPDALVMKSVTMMDPESKGTVRIGDVYKTSVKPSIRIPLAFKKSFSAEVRDTLPVPTQLKAGLKAGSASLSGEVTNTLPFAAKMTVKLIADDGTVLSSEAEMDVAAGASSPVNLTLTNTAGDGVDRLSKAVVTFKLSGTDDNRPVKQTDAIQADLKVKFQNN